MTSWWFVMAYKGDGWDGPGLPFPTKREAVESARKRVPADGCAFILEVKIDGQSLVNGERYRLDHPDGEMYPLHP